MHKFPEQAEQVRRVHAQFIHQIVVTCNHPELRSQLDPMLKEAFNNGWNELVTALRRILDGERGENLILGLDDEDQVIVESVLMGLQDPSTLPKLEMEGDASLAAPGLAALVHAASHGDSKALAVLADMAEQMTRVGGDMAKLGSITKKLIDGERDADKLSQGMDTSGKQLVLDLLQELNKLAAH